MVDFILTNDGIHLNRYKFPEFLGLGCRGNAQTRPGKRVASVIYSIYAPFMLHVAPSLLHIYSIYTPLLLHLCSICTQSFICCPLFLYVCTIPTPFVLHLYSFSLQISSVLLHFVSFLLIFPLELSRGSIPSVITRLGSYLK